MPVYQDDQNHDSNIDKRECLICVFFIVTLGQDAVEDVGNDTCEEQKASEPEGDVPGLRVDFQFVLVRNRPKSKDHS